MSRSLRVHFLPQLFEPQALRGGVAVVIDVLRASTTMIHALANGAEAVLPVLDVDEARREAANLGQGKALLGGERGGERIAGFDLDNSPFSYHREAVAGKTIVFTTTNGTRALLKSAESEQVLVGAFTNLNAVVEYLANDQRPIHLVCAGTDGDITSEDVLCAGAIAASIQDTSDSDFVPDDSCDMAMAFFRSRGVSSNGLFETLRDSSGGRNLQSLGFDADIRQAATCNLHPIIVEFDARTHLVRAKQSTP